MATLKSEEAARRAVNGPTNRADLLGFEIVAKNEGPQSHRPASIIVRLLIEGHVTPHGYQVDIQQFLEMARAVLRLSDPLTPTGQADLLERLDRMRDFLSD